MKLWHLLAITVLAWTLCGCASYGHVKYNEGWLAAVSVWIRDDQQNARSLITVCRNEKVQELYPEICSKYWAVKRAVNPPELPQKGDRQP